MTYPFAVFGLAAAALVQVAQPAPAQPAPAQPAQAELDTLALEIGYRFAVLDNRPSDCPGGGGCFVSEIAITMPDRLPAAMADAPLEIRFGYVSRMLSVESDAFTHRLINGDLNALARKPGVRLQAGKTYRVRLVGAGHFFSRFHVMPNAYLVLGALAPRVIAATRPAVDAATGLETLPFVAPMRDEARFATASPEDKTVWLTPERAFARYAAQGGAASPDVAIVPLPMKAVRPAGAPIDVAGGFDLRPSTVDRTGIAAALDAVTGANARPGRTPLTIRIAAKGTIAPEGYRLVAGDGRIDVVAADRAGVNHALRSLAQQIAADGGTLRPIRIEDAPRFAFRGLHIDVARNFHSKSEILKLLEQMAVYKLNTLHLHLGDDEGWRLQIKALPELTEIGGYRCLDPEERLCLQPQLGADPDRGAATNGFLSQDEYLEILRAAKARDIEVIPSLDMPGHSRSTIRSMEVRFQRLTAAGKPAEAARYRLVEPGDTTDYRSIQNYDDNTLNVCLDATYAFLDTVVGEIAAMHRLAGTPLKTYHIGADETAGAWTRSPACIAMMAKTGIKPEKLGAHFIERVSASLARRGIGVAGWSDGLGHTAVANMPKAVQSNIWGGLYTGGVAEAHGQANRGWKIVLSMPDAAYFDMPNAVDPEERGYDWAAREITGFDAFSFMPENLPANAALRTDILSRPARIEDAPALNPGRGIAGLQAQVWSETVRSDAQVDYMLFPRLLALAERAWHRADWEVPYAAGTAYAYGDPRVDRAAIVRDWRGFAARVAAQFPALDAAGVAYRLAPPGARIANATLEANTEYPGTTIEYRTGGEGWRRYTGPVAVTGAVTMRSRSPDGKRASRSIVVGEAK